MQLLLATTNKGKVIEIGEALSGLEIDFAVPTDFGIAENPHEHGETYRDNAILKAEFYHSRAKVPTLADDSGIVVHALKDELGVQTRRWGAGPDASDKEWIDYFLKRMEHESDKRATFICSLAYLDATGTLHTFEGACEGRITPTLEAGYLPGLPISACFRPDGFDAVYSAMSIEEKNATSHRGRALLKLRNFLESTKAPA